jgi:hypothetical protein
MNQMFQAQRSVWTSDMRSAGSRYARQAWNDQGQKRDTTRARRIRFALGLLLPLTGMLLASRPAAAIPAFAAQTGQACTDCHVGGFGLELAPLGRAFKIGGYTQRGGEGWASYVPLSVMIQTSFTNTASAQNPPPQHYAPNNNFSLDQISGFIGGGIGEHTGGLMQFT